MLPLLFVLAGYPAYRKFRTAAKKIILLKNRHLVYEDLLLGGR